MSCPCKDIQICSICKKQLCRKTDYMMKLDKFYCTTNFSPLDLPMNNNLDVERICLACRSVPFIIIS